MLQLPSLLHSLSLARSFIPDEKVVFIVCKHKQSHLDWLQKSYVAKEKEEEEEPVKATSRQTKHHHHWQNELKWLFQ